MDMIGDRQIDWLLAKIAVFWGVVALLLIAVYAWSPVWACVMMVVAPFLAVIGAVTIVDGHLDRRFPPRVCQSCGYEIQATISSQHCPECGRLIPVAP